MIEATRLGSRKREHESRRGIPTRELDAAHEFAGST